MFREKVRPFVNSIVQLSEAWSLARLRSKSWTQPSGSIVRCLQYRVRINDGLNFYMLYKDIFVRRIYHFETDHDKPLVLDCGSNIGMSILYFKRTYPDARVIGFEPDPSIFPYLEENIARNGVTDVETHQAALSTHTGRMTLHSDRRYGSYLDELSGRPPPEGWTSFEVPCVRLRDYLTEPIDFLKMNVEGAEWEILADSEDRLRQVREMAIEYHHLPGLPRTLHKILDLLDRCGYEYLVNDFDAESNGAVLPPFRLNPGTRYFLLIYANRRG